MPDTQNLDNPNPDINPDPGRGTGIVDRSAFSAHDVVADIWSTLKLPPHALEALRLPGAGHAGPALPSSFKIGILAQSSIALAALTAALLRASPEPLPPSEGRRGHRVPRVSVPLDRAVLEFRSEQLYAIDGTREESAWGSLGGLHRTSDGHVRIHDVFPNHAQGMLALLGLPPTATREDVAAKAAQWRALDLEEQGTHGGKLAIYALRSYAEWDATPQARAVSDSPILLRQIAVPSPTSTITSTGTSTASESTTPHWPWRPRGEGRTRTKMKTKTKTNRCLEGLRVLEMSRVIAAPVAGRTLAAHGADVLWVTSPHLPDIPALDRDLSRGKRSVHLDLDDPADRETLLGLLATCDVFLQGYRPGSLAARGLSPEALAAANPGIVVANLSAFGPTGPWAGARGFDSLVQACSGMNVSEAERAGKAGGEAARAMPCQALDHASGHLLAAGVMAALYRRAAGTQDGGGTDGGAYVVDVSLAGTMKYLRSLGQYPGTSGFEVTGTAGPWASAGAGVAEELMEERATAFGKMRALRHSAEVEGCEVGWERGPSVPGSDEPQWLLDA